VIQVVDRRTKAPKSLEATQLQLRNQETRDVITAKLTELSKNAKIQTFGLDGRSLPPPAAEHH
jgi:hypothetical protein